MVAANGLLEGHALAQVLAYPQVSPLRETKSLPTGRLERHGLAIQHDFNRMPAVDALCCLIGPLDVTGFVMPIVIDAIESKQAGSRADQRLNLTDEDTTIVPRQENPDATASIMSISGSIGIVAPLQHEVPSRVKLMPIDGVSFARSVRHGPSPGRSLGDAGQAVRVRRFGDQPSPARGLYRVPHELPARRVPTGLIHGLAGGI